MIDDDSPLAGLTEANVSERLFFVEAFLKGIDESYLQPVYMMHVFQPTDIRFDEQFTECVENSGGASSHSCTRPLDHESVLPTPQAARSFTSSARTRRRAGIPGSSTRSGYG